MDPESKFMRFMLFAAAVAGGTWLLYRVNESRTGLVMNKGSKPKVPSATAKYIGEQIGIDWTTSRFSVDEFARGIIVEMEHGKIDPRTNVTNDDVLLTAKIAWAHLNEFPDYYARLDRMEEEGSKYWGHEG